MSGLRSGEALWRRGLRDSGLPIVLPLPVPYAVRIVNAYLLIGDPLTIVDPGTDWGETRLALDAALAVHGVRLEEIEQVVITHQHHDHAGLAHHVRQVSGARVIAHRGLLRFLAGFGSDEMEAEDRYQADVLRLNGVAETVIDQLYAKSKAHRIYGGSVEVDRPILDGDFVHAGGYRLTVRERPGHSPSDLMLLDDEHRFALGGDHLIATISSNPVIHRPLDREADPRNRPHALRHYLDSLAATAELDVATILPGHGPPVAGHRELISERIAFHHRRKERIFAMLQHGRRTAHEVALEIWEDVARREAFLTLSEALGHLDLLEEEGRVVVIEEPTGRLSYEAAG